MRGALRFDDVRGGHLFLYNGAQEIGQGTATIMPQMFADARRPAARRGRAGDGRHRPHRRRRQVVGVAPDLRLGQRGARARAPTCAGSSSATRPAAHVSARAGAGRRLRPRRGARLDADRAVASRRATSGATSTWRHGLAARCRAAGRPLRRHRPLRPAHRAARCRRPGRALRHLRLRGADRRGRGRSRARHRASAPHPRRARRRPGDQPDAGRGPDPRRHRPGHRHGADGGVRHRPHRQPARLPDPDRRRRAADHGAPRRGSRAARAVGRQGRRRAGAGRRRRRRSSRDPRTPPACACTRCR